MPKNCKGCVRYKLLTIYQYAQSHLFLKSVAFFFPSNFNWIYCQLPLEILLLFIHILRVITKNNIYEL